jgi:hypothetical protein
MGEKIYFAHNLSQSMVAQPHVRGLSLKMAEACGGGVVYLMVDRRQRNEELDQIFPSKVCPQ